MDTLTLEFLPRTAGPLYDQLYRYIRREIESRRIPADEKLPSKRHLAAHLKISRNTVETAYEQLMAEGYIRSVPKSGYYVCPVEIGLVARGEKEALAPEILLSSTAKQQTYDFDFKTNTVDTSIFPFSTWAKLAKRVISADRRELLEPSHPQGDDALRESISRYLYHFRGVACSPEQVIVGAGTEYLLGLIERIIGPHARFAVENPGYPKTFHMLSNGETEPVPIAMDASGVKLDVLEKSGANAVYVTPSHQFPLGFVMPAGRRLQLIAWAAQKEGRYIIEDDYDSEFRFNGRPIPALAGMDTQGKVIYLSTFSKSIAPSIRVGYMVLPPELLLRYRKVCAGFSSTLSRFEQHILDAFLREGHFERHLNRSRNTYRMRRDALVTALREEFPRQIIDIIGASSGLHLLLRVKNGMDEEKLVDTAKNNGVRVYGLSDYVLDGKKIATNTVILGYANFTPQQIRQAVARLGAAWGGACGFDLGM